MDLKKRYILTPLLSIFIHFPGYTQIDSAKSIGNDKILTNAEVSKEDIGAWSEFLRKNIDFNIASDNGAPLGKYKVIVQFTILEDGELGEFKPITNYGFGMEDELIKALKKSPKWQPAFQNGKVVKVERKQSVTFNVNE